MASIESVLVTGGAGFIGSALCRHLIRTGYRVINIDKLTYAADLKSLREVEASNPLGVDVWRLVRFDQLGREALHRLARLVADHRDISCGSR